MLLVTPTALLAVPVWEFTFNDNNSGAIALNTGLDPNAANAYLTMRSTLGGTGNYRVADGPSGLPGDYSMSSVTSSGIRYADVPGGTRTSGISGFNQITISGWYKAIQPVPMPLQYTRIFLIGNRHLWDEGLVVDFNNQNLGYNQLGLEINDYYNRFGDGGGDGYAGPVPNNTGVWRFWAMTYDGVPTSNNVKIYMGTTAAAASLIGTASINHIPLPELNLPTNNPTGIIRNADGDFVVFGNIEWDYTHGLIGYQDNLRIYNSVLTQSQIELIRAGDVNVPEPVTVTLIAFVALLPLVRRRFGRS
jgi:hypothetical protein